MAFNLKLPTKTSQWVRDTDNVKRTQWALEIEKQKQNKIQWAKEQEADCVFIEDNKLDPSNVQRQMGKPLTPNQLEEKLIKLNPNLHFEVNPFNPKMKALYLLNGTEKDYICSYHNELMPEHSIVKVKKELVWDHKQTEKAIPRPETGTYEWVDGKMVFDNTKPRPGWKIIKKPYGELKRGWRTVLLKLVLRNLITVQQAETEFGMPSSEIGQRSWAWNLEKKKDPDLAMPW